MRSYCKRISCGANDQRKLHVPQLVNERQSNPAKGRFGGRHSLSLPAFARYFPCVHQYAGECLSV